MDFGDFAFKILVLLFPGVISTLIFKKLIIKRRWESYEIALNILLMGMLSYLVLQIWFSLFKFGTLEIWKCFETAQSIPYKEIIYSSIFATLLSFLSAAINNHYLINKIGCRLGVSNKYGDDNLFYYFLSHGDVSDVYIRDINRGLTYHGFLAFYSEDDDVKEIVLNDVDVYGYNDSKLYYSLPSIYLNMPKTENLVIEIPTKLNKNGSEDTSTTSKN